jgi:hypothetical protein
MTSAAREYSFALGYGAGSENCPLSQYYQQFAIIIFFYSIPYLAVL